jgi:hypothetical protein
MVRGHVGVHPLKDLVSSSEYSKLVLLATGYIVLS